MPEDTSELYDLSRDPGEDHDLSGLGEPAEERLAAILGERTDELAIPPGFAAHLKDAVSPTPTHPQSPLGDELSDLMRVVGADVEPGSIKPGATATVTVHFEVRKNIPDGWIVFTHAIGPGGRSMNLDHAPVGGLLPLSAIEAGRFVRDPIRISFPANWPAGPTRLELGLYKRGTRAPARGAHSKDGAVTVATIVVTP